jgi:phosphoglycolate phosphatase-like HAD superfamily hydrolase
MVMLLDVDGVILDHDRSDPEWERLAGQAFSPHLGGAPDAWHAAQSDAWSRVSAREYRELDGLPESSWPHASDWWDRVNAQWIEEACKLVGVTAPRTPKARADIAERALDFYCRNTRGVFPGTADVIAQLAERFELHMASGNPARIVEALLRRLNVRELIGFPFGSDLAGALKRAPHEQFYRAITTKIGGHPEKLIVVDDYDRPLAAARELFGAVTVRVGTPSETDGDNIVIDRLSSLPALIDSHVFI